MPEDIVLQSVAKRFGSRQVLESVSLSVPRGQTYAFLGRNGAGKTTTIRMLLGLLKPDAGHIEILGLDPRRSALKIRERVGYLAEDQRMFGWMRVSEILDFTAPFYPTWDRAYAERYRGLFDLDPRQRVGKLSKGQSVRLGLLLALAHRPELVILDDPTLGLDPIMRKELLRDVVDHLQGAGATVFFSSHLLYEVEPVADAVAILDRGRIVCQAPTETLRANVKRLIMAAADYDRIEALPGELDAQRSGSQVAVTVENAERALQALDGAGRPQIVDLNLDEIFEAYVIGKTNGRKTPEPVVERMA